MLRRARSDYAARMNASWMLALARACLIAAVASVAACAPKNNQPAATASDAPRAGEPQAEEQSCWRDSECVLVDDCCGCAHGGLRLSVRADKLDGVTARGQDECAQRACGEQASQHRSCTATAARCVGGRCLPAL